MLVELSDKEVKRIGEVRYQKPRYKMFITVSTIFLATIIALLYLDKSIQWFGYPYVIIGIGIIWYVWFYYFMGYKAEKAGKEFLKKMQEKI
jgi:L-asparagine transporter-like permease